MVDKEKMEIRHPHSFPIDNIAWDFSDNNVTFGTFNYLKKYIDIGDKPVKESLNEEEMDEILDAIEDNPTPTPQILKTP